MYRITQFMSKTKAIRLQSYLDNACPAHAGMYQIGKKSAALFFVEAIIDSPMLREECRRFSRPTSASVPPPASNRGQVMLILTIIYIVAAGLLLLKISLPAILRMVERRLDREIAHLRELKLRRMILAQYRAQTFRLN